MNSNMPLIDIRPDHWEIVRGILQKHVPQCEVWAFGSRATWKAKEFSDLDLAIISEKPMSLDISASLSDDFSQSDLPWKVDIVDWANTSDSFRKIIERDKVVLQEREGVKKVSDWKEERFGNLVCFVSEKLQAKDANIKTYISTENMLPNFEGVKNASSLPNNASVTRFKVGDTLFSNIRTYFKKVWRAKFNGSCSNDVLVFRSIDTMVLHPDYLHQLCRWEKFTELSIRTSKGAKMPRGDKNALADLKFTLPPLEEQRAIAHILGALDDKIELNRQINETLEAMARALFKAWFVDFEPVRAKQEGRWQRGQSLPGMPADLYDLFPERFVESELGEIPEGWRHSTIGEEVRVCGGSTPSTKEPEFWEGGQHRWATPKDLSVLKFPVLLDTDRKITDAGLAKISSCLLPIGTVLLSSRAPIGYLAIAEVPTAINQGFIAMKCDGVLPNVFILAWCRARMDTIVGNANGSTFQEISKSNFGPIPIVVPSKPVLGSFTKSADSLHRQLVENERESCSLAQLRDTLLPKLISGELRVPDAERIVGVAL